jgi:hypothetical protein
MTTRALALILGAAALVPAYGDTAATETAGYHLKNKSAFSSPESSRPPFWPVGWAKQAANAPVATPEAPVAAGPLEPDQFSVTSILLGAPSYAIINGKSYAVGEYLRPSRNRDAKNAAAIPAGARIRVQRITDGQVTLVASSQVLSVPLRRPSLTEHKADEDLPSVNDR